MKIKLLKKGIKIDGKYFPCGYSSSDNNIKGNATIYIRSYESLPKEAYSAMSVQNESDSMTDYYERDRIRIAPGNPLFNQVNELATF